MISIHAAREGGDDVDYIDKLTHTLFQSTPPVKAATSVNSSHALSKSFQSTPPVKAATLSLNQYC